MGINETGQQAPTLTNFATESFHDKKTFREMAKNYNPDKI